MGTFSPASPGISSVETTSGKNSFNTASGTTVGLTETSIVIPLGTVAFRLKAVSPNSATLTIAGASTGTGSDLTSFKLPPGNVWSEDISGTAALTVYIKSNKASTDVQLMLWT